jgi:hypothetical protein
MQPVSLIDVDNENSSFFDSDNYKELSSDEEYNSRDVNLSSKNNSSNRGIFKTSI